MLMENSNDTKGDQSRDLPACSAVPQPTAPPRTLPFKFSDYNFHVFLISLKRAKFPAHPIHLDSITLAIFCEESKL
jgi:hypothetical protein